MKTIMNKLINFMIRTSEYAWIIIGTFYIASGFLLAAHSIISIILIVLALTYGISIFIAQTIKKNQLRKEIEELIKQLKRL